MLVVGQKVQLVDEVGVFTVIAISGEEVSVRDEHDFDYVYDAADLVPITTHAFMETALRVDAMHKKEVDQTQKSSQQHSKNKKKHFVEYDLHAGVLLGNTAGMSNHQILTEQLDYAREMLDKARRNNDEFVVFVHGKGKGRLRGELHRMLAGIERIEFYDADYARYSNGATEVRLF